MNAIINNPELLKALIPVVTPLLIAAVRFGLPKVPSKFYPLLAAVIGVVLDLLASVSVGTTASPLVGFALGLAGVGLREVKDQLAKPAPKPITD
jgi:hypothetical protein